jgi:hypothetical protein
MPRIPCASLRTVGAHELRRQPRLVRHAVAEEEVVHPGRPGAPSEARNLKVARRAAQARAQPARGGRAMGWEGARRQHSGTGGHALPEGRGWRACPARGIKLTSWCPQGGTGLAAARHRRRRPPRPGIHYSTCRCRPARLACRPRCRALQPPRCRLQPQRWRLGLAAAPKRGGEVDTRARWGRHPCRWIRRCCVRCPAGCSLARQALLCCPHPLPPVLGPRQRHRSWTAGHRSEGRPSALRR